MKLIYCLLLLVCPYLNRGQVPVKAGERVPELVFKKLLNSKAKTIKLSQLRGKLVILDFWAAWCSNCIKKFNLLDSMQRQHADKLQVILVSGNGSRDGSEIIQAYLSKHRNAAGEPFAMPAAYADTVARKYFPYTRIPHYVWIGKDGSCLAITNSEAVTEANIVAVLQGQQPALNNLALMEDFDFDKPLFTDGNAGDGGGLLARSTVSHYIPGMASLSRYWRNEALLTTQYKMINLPLLDMLKKAYRTDVKTERIVFAVSDSMRQVLLPATAAGRIAGSYTYELICPPLLHAKAMALVQQDMQRYFGLYAKTEKRPADCYLLSIDTALLQQRRSKGGQAINKLYDAENRYLQNESLQALATWLDGVMSRPVQLVASVPFAIDLRLPDTRAGDDAALVQALAAQGIILTTGIASIEQFIIYQND